MRWGRKEMLENEVVNENAKDSFVGFMESCTYIFIEKRL